MTFVSNSLDFPNVPTKATPTGADIALLADNASNDSLAQSALNNFPGGSPSNVFIFPDYISGNWITPYNLFGTSSFGFTTNIIATGILFYIPIFFTQNVTITDAVIRKNATNAPTHTVVAGIYNPATGNNQPTGSPIANSTMTFNVVNSATPDEPNYTFSSPISLNAGVYFLGWSQSITGTAIASGCALLNLTTAGPNIPFGSGVSPASGANAGIFGTYNGSVDAGAQLGWKENFVFSTTLPSVGSISAAYGSSTLTPILMIAFKVQ